MTQSHTGHKSPELLFGKGDTPGDLVFFTGTYASAGAVSHVGIYVGGSRMLHCGSPIGYADLTSPYWNSHLYAFGRLATIPE